MSIFSGKNRKQARLPRKMWYIALLLVVVATSVNAQKGTHVCLFVRMFYQQETPLTTALYRNRRKWRAKLRDSEKKGIFQEHFGGAQLKEPQLSDIFICRGLFRNSLKNGLLANNFRLPSVSNSSTSQAALFVTLLRKKFPGDIRIYRNIDTCIINCYFQQTTSQLCSWCESPWKRLKIIRVSSHTIILEVSFRVT